MIINKTHFFISLVQEKAFWKNFEFPEIENFYKLAISSTKLMKKCVFQNHNVLVLFASNSGILKKNLRRGL